ncbi:MAG: pyruvate dehydrogenase (acetyl-transferring), homodimeric type, partial [Cellvibrionales bacterium]|nr:pyruvate dehydrogenase (acetyl-transferring), homodimeric type [Cellvibrionales bacterium]
MMTETLVDAQERQEWLDSLDAVVRHGGIEAGGEIVNSLAQHAQNSGVPLPQAITTPFKNTISPEQQRPMPGDLFMERRIRSLVRWNAMAMVM